MDVCAGACACVCVCVCVCEGVCGGLGEAGLEILALTQACTRMCKVEPFRCWPSLSIRKNRMLGWLTGWLCVPHAAA